jgi:hypothetical protein
MALDSGEQASILLSGPPALAKTMFLEYLRKLKKETTEHSSLSLIHILPFSIS